MREAGADGREAGELLPEVPLRGQPRRLWRSPPRGEPMTETRSCPICGEPVAPSRTRPRIFCSPAHRQAGYDLEQRRFSSPSGPLRLRSRPTRPQARWEAVRARGKRHDVSLPRQCIRIGWGGCSDGGRAVAGKSRCAAHGGKAWARVPTSLRLAYTDPTTSATGNSLLSGSLSVNGGSGDARASPPRRTT